MGSKQSADSKKGKPSKAGKRKGKFDRFARNTAAKKKLNVVKQYGSRGLAIYEQWLINGDHGSGGETLELPGRGKDA